MPGPDGVQSMPMRPFWRVSTPASLRGSIGRREKKEDLVAPAYKRLEHLRLDMDG